MEIYKDTVFMLITSKDCLPICNLVISCGTVVVKFLRGYKCMIRIAICDDEKPFRDNVKRYVERYLCEKEISYEIDTFSSGKEFLELGIEMIRYNIIFLDIKMDEIDGIVTAQNIRENSSDVYIVFVTAYIDYSLEGYKVNAERYLLKDNINFDNSIYESMDTILRKMNHVVSKKYFKFNECEKDIPLDRILYIESKLHKLEFHVMEKEEMIYTLYGTLNNLEEEMSNFSFLRIHQSFLVNMKHIKSVACYRAILSNRQEIVIPKVRYRDVKNTFVAFKGEM